MRSKDQIFKEYSDATIELGRMAETFTEDSVQYRDALAKRDRLFKEWTEAKEAA